MHIYTGTAQLREKGGEKGTKCEQINYKHSTESKTTIHMKPQLKNIFKSVEFRFS